MSLSLRALATSTSWPHSSSTLLAHGEWVPASIAMRMGCSEVKRRLKASGVVRRADPPRSPRRFLSPGGRGRSSCRLCPIWLSYLDALCYHPLRADPPSILGVRARQTLQTLRVLRMGVRPSHLIFRESPLQAVRFINRTPKTG